MSIEVKNLLKVYGEQKAVNNISFKVNKGEIVGFLGPNGAGKSTTMKIITGYLQQSSGEAFVCGVNVNDEPLETKKKIGYLPLIFIAIALPFSYLQTIEPDLLH